MAQVNAKCTNCGENILIDDNKEANICPNCNKAFITDKAIKLFNDKVETSQLNRNTKKRHVWKSLGKGLLMVLECFGYLFYCLFFVWLFVDITDNLKRK